MDERKKNLLKQVVENYIESAEPVPSQFLAEKTGLGVSGATIRNELRELEELGYLTHPHTSAGRIPTEKGYRLYVDELMHEDTIDMTLIEAARAVYEEPVKKVDAVKALAKFLAEETKQTVILGLGKDVVYYTGISHLFSQSEFREYALAVDMSMMFDQCERYMGSVFQKIQDGSVQVFIGSENPLGNACGLVVAKIGTHALFSILGPMRMRYRSAFPLVRMVQHIV